MLGGQRSHSHAQLHGQQKGHHSGDYYGDSWGRCDGDCNGHRSDDRYGQPPSGTYARWDARRERQICTRM